MRGALRPRHADRQGAAEAGSAGPQVRGRTGSGARWDPDVFFPSPVSEGTVHPAHARSELCIGMRTKFAAGFKCWLPV